MTVTLGGTLAADAATHAAALANETKAQVSKTSPDTFAHLPSAALAGAGARAIIKDSSVVASGNFGAVAAGGGTHFAPVFSDGTSWYIG